MISRFTAFQWKVVAFAYFLGFRLVEIARRALKWRKFSFVEGSRLEPAVAQPAARAFVGTLSLGGLRVGSSLSPRLLFTGIQ